VRRPPAVARVLERVTATARRHEMFEPGDLVLVWVSGGPDSICLLYSLWYLRRLLKIRLAVFHFDHRMREGSQLDARYVERVVHRLGLPFHARQADGASPAGESDELWARRQRTEAAGSVWLEIGATRHADGHTRDDQAETVLMAMILGWGLSGMGGIPPKNGTLVRPLLDVSREEVEAFCAALHLRPRRDPTNADTRLLRNAIRLEAIPAIERATGRRVRDTFARTADLLRQDADELWARARALADDLVRTQGDSFSVPASALRKQTTPMASRIVRRGFQMTELPWDEAAIDAVLDLASGRPGRRRDLLRGLRAWRDREYVRVDRPSLRDARGRPGRPSTRKGEPL
jgi:tRNA(Ile)-lysidine synthase